MVFIIARKQTRNTKVRVRSMLLITSSVDKRYLSLQQRNSLMYNDLILIESIQSRIVLVRARVCEIQQNKLFHRYHRNIVQNISITINTSESSQLWFSELLESFL